MGCLFCSIVAGSIPATIVYRDDDVVAFMDINPATPGHCLVVPTRHAEDLLAITPGDLAACTAVAQVLARRAVDELEAVGVNLINSCRAGAWQTVFHFHIHVIPRYEQDGMVLPWTPEPGDAAVIALTAASLRG